VSFLLDTCLVSELVRKQPSPRVLVWLGNQPERDLFLSVLTFGELQKGIARLPESPRRRHLQEWTERELYDRFAGRVVNVDYQVASLAGKLQGAAESEGFTLPVIDSLIAATAIQHGLVVVTRNVSDLTRCGADVLDPWEDSGG
jgi:predicted nucleic acid-binding protein